ncbi:MAG: rhodanese-like domain-containing protein, partial [Flavobacteriaceae bacterium]
SLLLLMVVFINVHCTQKKSMHINDFSNENLGNVVLVDVRTPEEYQEGHLEGAINIDWFTPDFTKQVEALGHKKGIYVYCKKGGRSAKAAILLDSLGYQVTDLLGGYDEYDPVE